MTNEKMDKAKELSQDIKYIQEQLQRIELVSGKAKTEISSNNRSFTLPQEIKEIIILISKADYEKKLKQKQKEFEEL